jgi:hypothetical protein
MSNTAPLTIKSAFSESFHLTKGFKWPIFKRHFIFLFWTFLMGVLSSIVVFVFKMIDVPQSVTERLVSFVVLVVYAKVLLIPCIMMGVRKSIGLTVDMTSIRADYSYSGKLIFYYTLLFLSPIWIFSSSDNSPLLLLAMIYILFFLILSPLLAFASPLIFIKKRSIGFALKSSYRKMKRYWKVVWSFTLMFDLPILVGMFAAAFSENQYTHLLVGLLMILFLIANIWLIPLRFTFSGVLFREAYRLKKRQLSVPSADAKGDELKVELQNK